MENSKKAGHTCIAPVPALVQLRCLETDLLKGIAGVRADSRVRILCDGRETDVERGELQLTEYGISGIPIFQLSRDVNYLLRDRKTVIWPPDMTEESYENEKTRQMLQVPVGNYLPDRKTAGFSGGRICENPPDAAEKRTAGFLRNPE